MECCRCFSSSTWLLSSSIFLNHQKSYICNKGKMIAQYLLETAILSGSRRLEHSLFTRYSILETKLSIWICIFACLLSNFLRNFSSFSKGTCCLMSKYTLKSAFPDCTFSTTQPSVRIYSSVNKFGTHYMTFDLTEDCFEILQFENTSICDWKSEKNLECKFCSKTLIDRHLDWGISKSVRRLNSFRLIETANYNNNDGHACSSTFILNLLF